MIKDKKEIGRRIRQIRVGLGMNQTEFGKFLGVVASSVSAYENGDTSPSFEMVAKIAKVGKVSIDDLLTGGRQDAPPHPDLYDFVKAEEEGEGIVPIDPDEDPGLIIPEVEHALGKLFACALYLNDTLGQGNLTRLLKGVPAVSSEEDLRLLSAFHRLDGNRRKRLIEEAEDMVLAIRGGGK